MSERRWAPINRTSAAAAEIATKSQSANGGFLSTSGGFTLEIWYASKNAHFYSLRVCMHVLVFLTATAHETCAQQVLLDCNAVQQH